MSLTWNEVEVLKKAQEEMARRLLAAAVLYQTEHRKRLNVSNPAPYLPATTSRPGEYPRARTGFGRDNVAYEPATVQGVIDAGFVVRLGYRASAWYMGYLEAERRRKGLVSTFDDLKGQIRAVLEKQA